MQQTYDLQDWEIVFVGGGGTLANDIMVHALPVGQRFYVPWAWQKFGSRLYRQAKAVNAPAPSPSGSHVAFVLYETSVGDVHRWDQRKGSSGVIVADMISAFPYYRPPDCVDMFTCVSGKMLGGTPGLGIVCIRKALVEKRSLRLNDYEVPVSLRLGPYLDNSIPYTPPIPQFYDLAHAIYEGKRDDIVNRINNRRSMLDGVIAPQYRVGSGPVYTIKGAPSDIVDFWPGLYHNGAGHGQLFLWSGTDKQYDLFCELWQRMVT
jgi:phosphoserine aminotransferase